MVERGDRLGAVGTSGRRSIDQPHLHLGVRDAGDRHAYHDPLDFLPPIAPPATEPQPPPAPAAAREPAAAAPVGAPAVAAPAGAPAVAALPAAACGTARSGRGAGARHGGAAPGAGGPRLARGGRGHPRAGSGPLGPRDHAERPVPGGGAGRRPPHRPARARCPAGACGGRRRRAAGPDPRRWTGRGPTASPEPQRPSIALPDRSRVRAARDTGGIDAGWLAAVIGLVAAATCWPRASPRRRDRARAGRAGGTARRSDRLSLRARSAMARTGAPSLALAR